MWGFLGVLAGTPLYVWFKTHDAQAQLDRGGVGHAVSGVPGAHRDAVQGGVRAQLGSGHVGADVAEQLLPRLHQQPHPQQVRQRPGCAEQSCLMPEQFGHPRLERVDRWVLTVDVVAHLCGGHRRLHPRGRKGESVTSQVDQKSSAEYSCTGLTRRMRPSVSRSATMNASSSDWLRFSRGSQAVS